MKIPVILIFFFAFIFISYQVGFAQINSTNLWPSPPPLEHPLLEHTFGDMIVPSILYLNQTTSFKVIITNKENFTLYDVQLLNNNPQGSGGYDKYENLTKIDKLEPNTSKTIEGFVMVVTYPGHSKTGHWLLEWVIRAKNVSGKVLESSLFSRYLIIEPNFIPTSPLKQYESGTMAKDVTCKQGFQLIIKAADGSPACVKPETKIKLVERGWGSITTHKMASSTIGLRITRLNNFTLNLKDTSVIPISNNLLVRFPELLNYMNEADAHYENIKILCLTAPSNDYCGVSGPTSHGLSYNITIDRDRASQLITG